MRIVVIIIIEDGVPEQNPSIFFNPVADAVVIECEQVPVVFRFVAHIQIIIVADGLPVAFAGPLYLFVNQQGPVVKSKIPSWVYISGELNM